MHKVGIYISWGNYSSLSSMHCLHRAYSICEYEYKSIIPDFFFNKQAFHKTIQRLAGGCRRVYNALTYEAHGFYRL